MIGWSFTMAFDFHSVVPLALAAFQNGGFGTGGGVGTASKSTASTSDPDSIAGSDGRNSKSALQLPRKDEDDSSTSNSRNILNDRRPGYDSNILAKNQRRIVPDARVHNLSNPTFYLVTMV
jgi:hypothetical protein